MRKLERLRKRIDQIGEVIVFYNDNIEINQLHRSYKYITFQRVEQPIKNSWDVFFSNAQRKINNEVSVYCSPYVLPSAKDLFSLANGALAVPEDKYGVRRNIVFSYVSARQIFHYKKPIEKLNRRTTLVWAKYLLLNGHSNIAQWILWNFRRGRQDFLNLAYRGGRPYKPQIFSFRKSGVMKFYESLGKDDRLTLQYGNSIEKKWDVSGVFWRYVIESDSEAFFLGAGLSRSIYIEPVKSFTSYKLMREYIRALFQKRVSNKHLNLAIWTFPALHLAQILFILFLFLYPAGSLLLLLFYFLAISAFIHASDEENFRFSDLMRRVVSWLFI